jgi:hypothetical protein
VSEEVEVRLRPFGLCQCGCGREGTLRVKAWRNGVVCVRSGCPCVSCRNKGNQSRGNSAQRKAAKRANIKPSHHEENMRGAHRLQHKEDAKNAAVVYRVWDRLKKDDDHARPIGDPRPLIHTFSQPRRTGGLLLMEDTPESVEALFIQRGYLR